MTNPDDRDQQQRQEPAQGASSKACSGTDDTLFHIEAVNTETGERTRMTDDPMTRSQCETNIRKLTHYPFRRFELVETPSTRDPQRHAAFLKIWRATGKDYKGRQADGVRGLMSYAKFGGGLVTADTISDAELAERLAEVRS